MPREQPLAKRRPWLGWIGGCLCRPSPLPHDPASTRACGFPASWIPAQVKAHICRLWRGSCACLPSEAPSGPASRPPRAGEVGAGRGGLHAAPVPLSLEAWGAAFWVQNTRLCLRETRLSLRPFGAAEAGRQGQGAGVGTDPESQAPSRLWVCRGSRMSLPPTPGIGAPACKRGRSEPGCGLAGPD